MTPARCVSVAGSDSGGGAGVQADLKAFAAYGCHGMSAVTAITAQNTVAVEAVHAVPPPVVVAQLRAIFDDIGCDAAKTGMLPTAAHVEAVAGFLDSHRVPLVVDPVLTASTGDPLADEDAVAALRELLIPLATVVTPNLSEAAALAPGRSDRRDLAEAIHDLGPEVVVITGGHGPDPSDHLFDGRRHLEIPVQRLSRRSTHGCGCTHSASLCALLALGRTPMAAAYGAAAAASAAIARGLVELGAGEGPVDVLDLGRHRDEPGAVA